MTQLPSLFVLVPGFGAPHVDEKLRILRSNVQRLQNSKAFSKIHIRVCCYDPSSTFTNMETDLWNNPNIEWIAKPGIVGQYIHQYANPRDVEGYDYVMIILDDVELMPDVDMTKMIGYVKALHLDILSPSMTTNSKYQYQYMLHDPTLFCQIKIVAACEAFCYLMPKASYLKYYSIIEPDDNPWLWGVDLVLHRYHNMHVALVNNMQMHHHFKGECYRLRRDTSPSDGYNSVIRKYNVPPHEFENMQAVLFFVLDSSGL